MDMDLHEQPLGSEGNLKVELKEGKLLLSIVHASKGVEASLGVAVSSDYFFDKIAELIPGQVDDAVFAIIKGALKS